MIKIMKELDEIWNSRLYHSEVSWTNNLALMLQPVSFNEFGSHPEFVEAFRLWTQNDSFRGLDIVRVWSMILNVKNILAKTRQGSVAELGVYHGQSAALLSFFARKFDRKIYLIDTFEGFSEDQFENENEEDKSDGKRNAFKDVSLEKVRQIVGDYSRNRWIVGVFPDSITDEMRDDRYAFVSIDCDIHDPIANGLRFFWPRMIEGGQIFIHDYSSGHWPGAKRAVDNFCSEQGVAGCLLPDFSGSYVLTCGK
jgi:macrocin-O-methyltransferase TylF-like protien